MILYLTSLFDFPFLLYLVFTLIKIVCLLASIAYYTLAERKIMAAVQRRRGPNVVGFWGLLQPLADGVKLFAKEMVIPSHSNGHIFLFAPIAILTLSLLSWSVIPFYLYEPLDSASISSVVTALAVESEVFLFSFLLPVDGVSALRYSVLFLLAISSLNVYGIIIAGWSSSSKYAFLGSLRSAAQMISYEVSISLILLSVVVLSGSLDLVAIVEVQRKTIWFVVPLLPSAIIFFISMLAETNRAPFDLPEAEAELVAGYNVEYSSIIFAMFFLGEYSNMILMSTIASLLFLGGWASCEAWVIFSPLSLVIKIIVVAIFFILVRASYPRYRYDQLMDLGWKVFLPVITGFFIFEVGLLKVFGAFPKVAELPVYTLPNTGDAWTLFSPLELNSVSDLVGQIIFILGRNFFWLVVPLTALLLCAVIIVSSNPVHSLLSLIAVFFHVVFMLLSLRVEFLGLVFLIIYVGAIAILFLFVLMLFNLKDLTRSAQELTTLQWSLFLLITPALVKIYFLMVACFERFVYTGLQLATPTLAGETVKTFSTDTFYDIFSISGLMYSRYTGPFVLISYILLTAMIGAIVLAMHTTPSRENRPNTTFSPLYGVSALVLAYKDGVSTLALADPDGTFFFYFIENTDSYFESSGSTPLLAFTSLLYLVGLTGMIFNYKNFLVTMMSVELMYLGVVSSFVILGTSGVTDASATGMLILILVACESAIGLGILIVLYRFGGSVAFKDFEQLGTTLQSKKRSRRRI